MAALLAVATLTALPTTGSPVSAITNMGPFNDRLAIQVDELGQFNIGALPDPTTGDAVTGSFSLSFEWPLPPGTSFATVRVGTTDTELRTPTTPPAEVTGELANTTGYTAGDVGVTQKVSIVDNPFSGRTDLGRIEYTVTNNGSAAADVGLRYLNDVDVAGNDEAPFRVPGVGEVTTETEFAGATIPQYFNVFNDLSDAQRVGLAVISGNGATTPDRVVIGRWPEMDSTTWDYTSAPGTANGDSAYLVYFNPTSLAAGASRTYVTYYGLGDVSVTTGPNLSVGATSPAALELTDCAYVPNPFEVVGTIENTGTAPATGVTAALTLPAGLSLAAGDLEQAVPDLAVGASAEVTWSVTAANRATAADLEIGVSAAATGITAVTTTRTVSVPAACAAENTPPVATDQSLSTPVDTALPVTLAATDANGDPLTFAVVSQPANGTLTGTAPDLTYTPAAGFTGSDSFTFTANDGTADSNVATITIQVGDAAVNTPPVASDQSLSTPVDTALPVTLAATDADADPLTFAVVSQPANGTLTGTAPDLTYRPAAGFTGSDSFTFTANDGTADSNVATVTIQVGDEVPPVECLEGRSLKYSTSARRSHGELLDGATVGRAERARRIAVFLAPYWRNLRGDDRVVFELDGVEVGVEHRAPYDLLGTRRNGKARLLDVTELEDGPHTVRVTVEWRDDRPPCSLEATFTVDNTRPDHEEHGGHGWGHWHGRGGWGHGDDHHDDGGWRDGGRMGGARG